MQRYILQRYLRLFYPGLTISEILLTELRLEIWWLSSILKEGAWVEARVVGCIIETTVGAHIDTYCISKRTLVLIELLEELNHKGLKIKYHILPEPGLLHCRSVVVELFYPDVNTQYFNGTEI